jgi:hypothetical protein
VRLDTCEVRCVTGYIIFVFVVDVNVGVSDAFVWILLKTEKMREHAFKEGGCRLSIL